LGTLDGNKKGKKQVPSDGKWQRGGQKAKKRNVDNIPVVAGGSLGKKKRSGAHLDAQLGKDRGGKKKKLKNSWKPRNKTSNKKKKPQRASRGGTPEANRK